MYFELLVSLSLNCSYFCYSLLGAIYFFTPFIVFAAQSALASEHCLGGRMLEIKVATPKVVFFN